MNRRSFILKCLTLAGAAGFAALLFLFPPDEVPYWPKCLLHQTTGLHCPGCGATRALAALLHGDLRRSLANNLLLIPALIAFLTALWHPKLLENRRLTAGALAVLILFAILRNLPWQPFCLLAPH